MSSLIAPIIKIELKRFFTLPKIIVMGIVTLIASFIAIVPSLTGFLDSEASSFFVIKDIISYLLKIVIPFSVFFITPGIIAHDINNYWFRTIFSRPVDRGTVLISKYLYATVLLIIFVVLYCVIPIFIFWLTAPQIKFQFIPVMVILIFSLLEGILFISIAIWFSCFLSKFFNVLLLAIWMFADSSIITPIISTFFWDSPFWAVFSEFFFPGGFANSMSYYSLKGAFPTEHFFWGVSALALFMALSFYHFNIINIDRSGND